jgi:hypothetical protein
VSNSGADHFVQRGAGVECPGAGLASPLPLGWEACPQQTGDGESESGESASGLSNSECKSEGEEAANISDEDDDWGDGTDIEAAGRLTIPDLAGRRASHHEAQGGRVRTDQNFVKLCLGDSIYAELTSQGYVFNFEKRYGAHGRYVFRKYMEWPQKKSLGPILCVGVLGAPYDDVASVVAMYNNYIRAMLESARLRASGRDGTLATDVEDAEPPNIPASDESGLE